MERNEKIAFGVLFTVAIYQRWKLIDLFKIERNHQQVLELLVDREYQQDIDKKFEEMTENFDW